MAVAAAQADLFSCIRRGNTAASDPPRIAAVKRFLPPHQAQLATSRIARSQISFPFRSRSRNWRGVPCEETRRAYRPDPVVLSAGGRVDGELAADRASSALLPPRFATRVRPTGGAVPTGGELPAAASSRAAACCGGAGRSGDSLRLCAGVGADSSEDGGGGNMPKRRVQGPWKKRSSLWLRSGSHLYQHQVPLRAPSLSSSAPSFASASSGRVSFRTSSTPRSAQHSAASSAVPRSSAVSAASGSSISLEADALVGTGPAQEAALADRAIARADAAAAAAAATGGVPGAVTVTGGRRGGGRGDYNEALGGSRLVYASSHADTQRLAAQKSLSSPSPVSPASPSSPSLRLSSPPSPTSSRDVPLRRRPLFFPLRLLRVRFLVARRALRALTLRQALRVLLAACYWLRWPLVTLALVLGATWQMSHPGVRAARPVAYSDMVGAVKAGRVKNAAIEEGSNRIWFNVHRKTAAAETDSAASAAAAADPAVAASAAAADAVAVGASAAVPVAAIAAPTSSAAATSVDSSDRLAVTSADTAAAVEAEAPTAVATSSAPAAAAPATAVDSATAVPSPSALASSPSPSPSSWRSFLVSRGPPWSSIVRLPADPPFAFVTRRIPNDEAFLLPLLLSHDVRVASVPVAASQTLRTIILTALTIWIPVAPLIYLMMKQLQGGRDGGWRRGQGKGGRKGKGAGGQAGGRGSAKQVAFEDVAGVDEAKRELMELVQGIKGAGAFAAMGAHIPKGVLLIGPPGTGKTLLARAVAAEADVPFFAASASEFVEMFVGRGAARVRDLFREARKAAPAIVFIDEIDAVGARRGASSNDERDQTLNQLLTELDGFDSPDDGVLLLAATNRLDTLDPALTRSGRISRRVMVPLPGMEGRRDILRVHMRRMRERARGGRRVGVNGGGVEGGVGKMVRGGVGRGRWERVWDVLGEEEEEEGMRTVVARYTEGFSGADLENVVNEAAWLAARSGESRVSLDHLLDAVHRTRNGINTTSSSTGIVRMKPAAVPGGTGNPLRSFLSRALGPLVREESKDVPARAISPGV